MLKRIASGRVPGATARPWTPPDLETLSETREALIARETALDSTQGPIAQPWTPQELLRNAEVLLSLMARDADENDTAYDFLTVDESSSIAFAIVLIESIARP